MARRNDVRARAAKYGLDEDELAWLTGAHDGLCAICGRPEPTPGRSLAVDHDHATGTVRGLLCGRCNQTLGRMNDDPALLRAMADYLDRTQLIYASWCLDCAGAGAPAESAQALPVAAFPLGDGYMTFQYRHDCGTAWSVTRRTRGLA